MFIDIHVHPAFYEPINEDPAREDLRHEALDIHKNGTAPLEHIFNQMRCAGLDKLCLLPEDYSGSVGCLVTNEEIKAGMASFRGVDRRFDFKVKTDKVVYLSD